MQPDTAPHNLEMEAALLGAVLRNVRAFDVAAEAGLRAEHFHAPEHQRIWTAAAALIERGEVATPITLRHYFEADAGLALAGGPEYLFELTANVVAVINTEHYARTLIDLHQCREIIGACQVFAAEAASPNTERPASAIAADLIAAVDTQAAASSKPVTAAEAYGAMLDELGAIMRGERTPGLGCGIAPLDDFTGGFRPGELTIIAGRPSMGKSALALSIAAGCARMAAQGDGGRVLFLSLEMSAGELLKRIASDLAGVNLSAIQRGTLSDQDYGAMTQAMAEARALPLDIDAPGVQTVQGLAATCRRIKRQHGLSLVVVDYLQLLTASRDAGKFGPVAATSELSRGLKQLAASLAVPVVALSQLSRAVEQREDKRPMLADLRESGAIEQDADNVMFVYREAYYLERSEPVQGEKESIEKFLDRQQRHNARLFEVRDALDVIVAKQRQGPVGTVTLGCNLAFQRIRAGRDGLWDRRAA